MRAFATVFNRLRREEKGVTLVEYGIALVLAIVVGGAAITSLGGAINDQLNDARDCLAGTAC